MKLPYKPVFLSFSWSIGLSANSYTSMLLSEHFFLVAFYSVDVVDVGVVVDMFMYA